MNDARQARQVRDERPEPDISVLRETLVDRVERVLLSSGVVKAEVQSDPERTVYAKVGKRKGN